MNSGAKSRNIVIRLSAQGIYYNNSNFLPYTSTNLPHEHFTVSDRNEHFWLAQMLSFHDSVLCVQIINYKTVNGAAIFQNQNAKKHFSSLHFQGLDIEELKGICTSYKASKLKDMPTTPDFGVVGRASLAKLSFSVSVKRLHFEAGRVTFQKKMKWQKEPVHFAVANSHILPEFKYVQQFVGKQLGTSKISVHVTIESAGSNKLIRSCTSPELDAIGPDFFKVLKFKKVAQVSRHIVKSGLDQSLLDLNGYLGGMKDESLHKLGLSGSDIIEDLLRKKGIRNRQHIDFMANTLHKVDSPIYITLSPSFGFLFLAEGEQKVHYLWEMLNSNATYIWSFGRQVSESDRHQKITDLISYIRVNGRSSYLQDADMDSTIDFTRIYHSKVRSHVRDHFPYWKFKIEETIY